jgi:hypothetical protein
VACETQAEIRVTQPWAKECQWPPEGGRDKKWDSTEASGGDSEHRDFRFPPSRTVREKNAVLSHWFVIICYYSLRKLTQPAIIWILSSPKVHVLKA